jgi:hypothetical protein
MSDIPEQPKKSAADVAYGVTRAAVSAVPWVGSPSAELIGVIFGPPLERRREEWMEKLAGAVREVQEKLPELTPEKLSSDPAFISVAMRATEIAIRTHEQEKLEALRNAIVNSQLPESIDETIQQIFLNNIDVLTAWHLKLLVFFDDPPDWTRVNKIQVPNLNMGSPAQILEHAMHDLAGKRDFYNRLVEDLVQRGLMPGGGIHTMMTGSGTLAPRTTPWAKLFVKFISKR